MFLFNRRYCIQEARRIPKENYLENSKKLFKIKNLKVEMEIKNMNSDTQNLIEEVEHTI